MDHRLSLVLAFLLSSVLADVTDRTRTYLINLEKTSYDKNIPPEGNDGIGTPIKVVVSTHILDIHTVDDSNLDFIANLYFRQSWNDSRLKYNMDVDYLIFNTMENIWTPDLFFVEEREGSLHHIVKPNTFLRIYPNGKVLLSSRCSMKLHCPMDLRNYPHDIQKCAISIESYAFQRKHLELQWLKSYKPVTFTKDMPMLEFDLIDAEPVKEQIEIFSSGNYTRLQINLIFKRKFGFFATRLYVPFIILILMASLSLWIKPEERCLRLALLLVILYLMITISTSMNDLTPPAPYTKGSDVWIGFCESMVFAVFLEFVVVALIAKRESEDDSSKTKDEILMTLDPEDKGSKLKSPLNKMMNMFDARRGGLKNSLSLRIDKICRLLFPIIFVIFNIVYWSVYCS